MFTRSKNKVEECSICLTSDFEEVGCLNCFHTFCFACIRNWLVEKTSCPICRRGVTSIQTVIPKKRCSRFRDDNSYIRYDRRIARRKYPVIEIVDLVSQSEHEREEVAESVSEAESERALAQIPAPDPVPVPQIALAVPEVHVPVQIPVPIPEISHPVPEIHVPAPEVAQQFPEVPVQAARLPVAAMPPQIPNQLRHTIDWRNYNPSLARPGSVNYYPFAPVLIDNRVVNQGCNLSIYQIGNTQLVQSISYQSEFPMREALEQLRSVLNRWARQALQEQNSHNI